LYSIHFLSIHTPDSLRKATASTYRSPVCANQEETQTLNVAQEYFPNQEKQGKKSEYKAQRFFWERSDFPMSRAILSRIPLTNLTPSEYPPPR
jgi:hypothetical protein